MPHTTPQMRILFLIDEIKTRLSELSPQTLLKVESSLGFAVFQMDEADVINAEIVTTDKENNENV